MTAQIQAKTSSISSNTKVSSKSEPRPYNEPEKVRPISSFKIKDSLREISNVAEPAVENYSVEEPSKIDKRQPVDEQKIVAALEKYIAGNKPEPTIAIALRTHIPEVQGEHVAIAVDNQLQVDKLEALKPHIQNSLCRELDNGYLVMEFKLFNEKTSKEEKKLFTSGEKFEHFLKLNPVIAELKAKFGLELD